MLELEWLFLDLKSPRELFVKATVCLDSVGKQMSFPFNRRT
jgi:hypothetical protein